MILKQKNIFCFFIVLFFSFFIKFFSYAAVVADSQTEVIPRTTSDTIINKLTGFNQSFKANDGYLDFGLRLGYINGYTAFDFNHHVSELEYPFRNIIGGGNISFGYKGFSLNVEMWGTLDNDAGWNLKDKDWDDQGQIESDTRSRADMNAIIMDGNMRYDFYRYFFDKNSNKESQGVDNIRVGLLGGYRYQRFGYDGWGLIGSSEQDENDKVFTYKIKHYMPYCGLGLNVNKDKFGMNMSVKYALKPRAQDQDYHVLRGLIFHADYKDNPNVFIYNIVFFWKIIQNLQLNFGADVSLIRLDGKVWEEQGEDQWDKEQSSDTKQFIYWTGLSYKF